MCVYGIKAAQISMGWILIFIKYRQQLLSESPGMDPYKFQS